MKKFLKKTEGFTLVELIVVIAILGILAGVGTVGYSGYIKKANMAADQVLLDSLNTAYAVACELIEHRYVRGRVTTGLTLLNVESVQTAIYYFNSRYTGVYVYESVSDVLVYGDLVLTVNGQKIETVEDVSKAIEGLGVGDTVEFVVYRNQQETTVQLTLMEYIPDYLLEDENSVMPAA